MKLLLVALLKIAAISLISVINVDAFSVSASQLHTRAYSQSMSDNEHDLAGTGSPQCARSTQCPFCLKYVDFQPILGPVIQCISDDQSILHEFATKRS